jgi:tetrathionate reductase subunit B
MISRTVCIVREGQECLVGNGQHYTATTDNFGDFWFEGLPTSTFNLNIIQNGKKKMIEVINNEKDVNSGDVSLN